MNRCLFSLRKSSRLTSERYNLPNIAVVLRQCSIFVTLNKSVLVSICRWGYLQGLLGQVKMNVDSVTL